MTCSPDQKKRIKALWLAGKSATIVGRELGLTKGQVIGVVWRAGLKRTPEAQRATVAYGDLSHKRRLAKMEPKRQAIKPKAQSVAESPKPFLNLPRGACKWPLDTPPKGQMFAMLCCANAVEEGHPYCPAHERIAFVSAKRRAA